MVATAKQADIARACDVSRASVSFALNPKLRERLKPETVKLILDTAKELGYHPNHYAQMMRKKRTGKIGFIMAISILETSLERTLHATQAIHDSGFGVISSNMMWDNEDFNRALELMLESRVEGILLSGMGIGYPQDVLRTVVERGIPIVKLIANPFENVPHVCSDHKQGMRLLTEHIIKQGRRKLAMIGPVAELEEDKTRFYDYNERILGFRSAANTAGIPPEESAVVSQSDMAYINDEYKPGYLAMLEIIESGKLPEAVVCVNDHWASGAMRACSEAGIGVPDDIAFGGFDNNGFAPYLYSPLTSVAQPSAQIGQVGVDLLMRWISGEDVPSPDTQIQLPCELVVRESCGGQPRE